MDKMYSERFLKFIKEFVFPHECAFEPGHYGDMDYVTVENVAGDSGGATKYGIDSASHPNEDIKNLTMQQALEIYWNSYWVPSKAESFPFGFGEVLCDIKINGGNGPRLLQRALNKYDNSIIVDGVLGPQTMNAVSKIGLPALQSFLINRQDRYIELSSQGVLKKFLAGWINRNSDLSDFVQSGLKKEINNQFGISMLKISDSKI